MRQIGRPARRGWYRTSDAHSDALAAAAGAGGGEAALSTAAPAAAAPAAPVAASWSSRPAGGGVRVRL